MQNKIKACFFPYYRKANSYFQETQAELSWIYADSSLNGMAARGTYYTYRCLKDYESSETRFLFHVSIPGVDETNGIDLLMLTTKGIIIINAIDYTGTIIGDTGSPLWSYTRKRRAKGCTSEQILNPVLLGRLYRGAIEDLLGHDIPVWSVTVVSEKCRISNLNLKGQDDVVVNRYEIYDIVGALLQSSPDVLDEQMLTVIYDQLFHFTRMSNELKVDRRVSSSVERSRLPVYTMLLAFFVAAVAAAIIIGCVIALKMVNETELDITASAGEETEMVQSNLVSGISSEDNVLPSDDLVTDSVCFQVEESYAVLVQSEQSAGVYCVAKVKNNGVNALSMTSCAFSVFDTQGNLICDYYGNAECYPEIIAPGEYGYILSSDPVSDSRTSAGSESTATVTAQVQMKKEERAYNNYNIQGTEMLRSADDPMAISGKISHVEVADTAFLDIWVLWFDSDYRLLGISAGYAMASLESDTHFECSQLIDFSDMDDNIKIYKTIAQAIYD